VNFESRSETLSPTVQINLAGGDPQMAESGSGGGRSVCMSIEVEPGVPLRIEVDAVPCVDGGVVEVHLARAPETSETRLAAQRAREGLAAIEELRE
jgi:hypothetical protein